MAAYHALIWGVRGDDRAKLDAEDDGYWDTAPWADPLIGKTLMSGCEADQCWCGVPIAAGGDYVWHRERKIHEMKHLTLPLAEIGAKYADEIASARAEWYRVRDVATENGVELPAGELMLVFDYS